MKKILLSALFVVTAYFALVSQASAKEGLVTMSNSGVSCEAISLWKEGRYRVSGRCDGLTYPYETQYSYYVLWAKTDTRGEYTRVAEVSKGYFDGGVADSFSNLYITAETSNLPRRPSGKNVVSGGIVAFAFDKSQDTTVAVEPAAQEPATGTMTVQNGATSTVASNSTVGKVVSKILTSLLVIVAVVVVLVIATSLVFRRRGSVSV